MDATTASMRRAASSADTRSVMSALTPITPTTSPASSSSGRLVTSAVSSLPSRRRTTKSPVHDRPLRSAVMISSACSRDVEDGVRSTIDWPIASAALQPYSSSAARFQ